MVQHFTSPDDIESWVICDNHSDDFEKLVGYKNYKLPHMITSALDNIGDLPRYNDIIPEFSTDIAIVLSTDCRVLDRDWISKFLAPFADPMVAMVGKQGPGSNMGPEHAGSKGGSWHWVPKLLVDRGIEFDNCTHIQTHAFAVRKIAFEEVGGFWTPSDGSYLDKGNLIAGEMAFSVKLRKAGWKLNYDMPSIHHYGNQAPNAQSLDDHDRRAGWPVDF